MAVVQRFFRVYRLRSKHMQTDYKKVTTMRQGTTQEVPKTSDSVSSFHARCRTRQRTPDQP